MRTAVATAWPAHVAQWEGVTSWMYLDTVAKVTVGTGNLIDPMAKALALPWWRKDGTRASGADILDEWRRVKARTDWTKYNGLMAVWRDSAVLNIDQATIKSLLSVETTRHWAGPLKALPALESYPADAQLAILDLAWQNGPAFLDTWNDTRRALLAENFAEAAAVLKAALKASPRTTMRVRLLTNAATVKALRLDPAVLWDEKAPTSPPVVVTPPVVTPPPAKPVEELPMVARVAFRGGVTCSCVANSLPWVEYDMLRQGLIRNNIDIMQMIGTYGASKGTHSQGGCVDVEQRNPAQIKVWRKWGWTMQERIGVGSGPHAHGWPYGCPHLAPEAKSQQRDWDRKDAGLIGQGRVVGPWPVKKWDVALRENKVALLDEIEAAAYKGAAAAIKKGIDVNAVWQTDALDAPAYALVDDPKNLNWRAASYLKVIAEGVKALRGSMENRAGEARRIEAALKAVTPAVKP